MGVDEEGHTNMITQLPPGAYDEAMAGADASVLFNNDFIGKNRNMLAFFREHD